MRDMSDWGSVFRFVISALPCYQVVGSVYTQRVERIDVAFLFGDMI